MVAAVITVVVQAFLGGYAGDAVAGTAGLIVGVVIGLVLGGAYGWAVGSARAYSPDVRGVLLFLVDHTWSLPNTVVGALWLLLNVLAGNRVDRAGSRHRNHVRVDRGLLPGYATTIGTVEAGVSPENQRHEDLHVWQGRALGPLYLPSVIVNYPLFTVLPVWLLWHDHRRTPITSVGRFLLCGVYPHVWNEAHAHRRAESPRPPR